jgi:hypothetical protein
MESRPNCLLFCDSSPSTNAVAAGASSPLALQAFRLGQQFLAAEWGQSHRDSDGSENPSSKLSHSSGKPISAIGNAVVDTGNFRI